MTNVSNFRYKVTWRGQALKVLVFGFCCWLVPPTLQAQSFKIGNVKTLKATAFDEKNQTIFAIWSDSIREYKGPDYQHSVVYRINPPDTIFPKNYYPVVANSTLLFIHAEGGLVHRLKNGKLSRIDRSYNHKMQVQSSIFLRNDTLFRYGGYGFWSERNLITYFDPSTHEWEVVSPNGSEQIPEGSYEIQVFATEDSFYAFSGLKHDVHNPLISKPYPDIWNYNFSLRKWHRLGVVDAPLYGMSNVVTMEDGVLYFDQYSNAMQVANPVNNTLTTYARTGSLHWDANYTFLAPPNELSSFYSSGNFILLETLSDAAAKAKGFQPGDLVYSVVPKSAFLENPIRVEALYRKDGFPWQKSLALLGLIALMAGLFFFLKKNKTSKELIAFQNKSLSYQGRTIYLEPEAAALLEMLLQSNGSVSSGEVIRLLENPSLSEAHNFKVKNQVVESLNLNLRTLLNAKQNLIETRRSDEDKRVKSYTVDVKRFKRL